MRIETKRLILREWKESDIDFVVDGLNDFNVAKNLVVPYPYTKKDAIDFISKHLENTNNDYHFAVVQKKDNKVVGGTSLSKDDKGIFHGGIWLHRNFQGLGYGTEIFTARAKFAFDYLKLNELENGFFSFNERSKKMQLKIGYKIVGKQERYCPALKDNTEETKTKLSKKDFEKYYNSIDFEFLVE